MVIRKLKEVFEKMKVEHKIVISFLFHQSENRRTIVQGLVFSFKRISWATLPQNRISGEENVLYAQKIFQTLRKNY